MTNTAPSMTLIDSKREEEMTDELLHRLAAADAERAYNEYLAASGIKLDAVYMTYERTQHLTEAIRILSEASFVVVPVKPTMEMLNAAIDVDSFKLGDISPLGFRISPQQLFEKCYTAMIRARKTP